MIRRDGACSGKVCHRAGDLEDAVECASGELKTLRGPRQQALPGVAQRTRALERTTMQGRIQAAGATGPRDLTLASGRHPGSHSSRRFTHSVANQVADGDRFDIDDQIDSIQERA